MTPFNSLCHQLMDLWVEADFFASPDELTDRILDGLSIKMALSVIETVESDPHAWRFTRVRDFGYKSKVLDKLLARLPNAPLGELDRTFVDDAVIPGIQRVLRSKRPAIDIVKTRLLGVRIGYERLIIPQKTEGKPEWCISLAEGRFAIPQHQEFEADIVDEGIAQLLIEGHTAKEIAQFLSLSPRTIEHRIGRMKVRLEAKNLVHLVAKLIGTQIDRADKI